MTTTLKHQQFVAEDMKDKPVIKLPGIGTALGTKLAASGYPLAKDIYAQLKTFDFDKAKFQEWLKTICGASSKFSSDCYVGLKDWHDQFASAAEKNKTKKDNTKKDSPEKDNAKANTSCEKCNCEPKKK